MLKGAEDGAETERNQGRAKVVSYPMAEDVLGAGREGCISEEKDSIVGEHEDIFAWHSACSCKQTCFKHK